MVAYIVNFTDPEVTPFNVNSFTTDGPVAPNTLQLSSSAVKASTSLVLYGKGHPQYGERIQENLVNLMENFSGSTAPTFPTSGQTWFSRITYVLVGVGSPGTANSVFRWADDDSNPDGGSWIALTSTGGVDPTAADEVKTSGTQPTTIVDGSFWLDLDGSPLVPELYLAVNNSTSNLAATFLKREMEDLTGLITVTDLTTAAYKPQKQLKVFDGVGWKNSGSVFTSDVAPQRPATGDLWFQTSQVAFSPSSSSNQLYVYQDNTWQPTGYVDTGGDIMTGPLSFGLPLPHSLVIWGNGGDSTTGSDIQFLNNGVLSSNTNLYILIDNDNNAVLGGSPNLGDGSNVFEVATGSTAIGGSPRHRSLFQVQNDGVVRSALSLGSPEGSVYETLILSSDKNALVNRRYVDQVGDNVSGNTANIAANTAHIAILQGGGSPFQAKVNRSGDTMTGQLTFAIGGSPQNGVPGISMGDLLITNLQTPQAPEDATTKQYVDDQVSALFGSPSPAGFNDGVVFNATWNSSTSTLTLNRTEGLSDVTVVLTPDVSTDEVIHVIDTPFLRDTFQQVLFGSPMFGSPISDFPLQTTQQLVNKVAVEEINTRLATVEAPLAREIFTAGVGSPLATGGSPTLNMTTFTYAVDEYVAGTNRLQVYVNGVKQYVDERAWQKISFLKNRPFNGLDNNAEFDFTQPNISPSARTQLSNDSTSYTLDVAVDGGGPTTMTATGTVLQIYDDIIDEINAQVAGATAVWSEKETAIVIYSNSSGSGSQITVSDFGSPIGSSLLGALSEVELTGLGSPTPGAGSPNSDQPFAYTQGDITPAASGPISLVSQDLSYKEVTTVGSPIIDATFGATSSTIVFNTQLNPGDVVEIINVPVSS